MAQKANNSQLNPVWKNYTPTIGGFSSVAISTAKYMKIGKTVFIEVAANGTSNANLVTITYPPGLLPANNAEAQGGIAITGDTSNYYGAVNHMSGGNNYMRVYKGLQGASGSPYSGWNTTGGKAFFFQLWYTVA